MRYALLSLGLLAVVHAPVQAAGVLGLSGPLTDDASTGISTSNIYTHAVSGGTAVSVNGVAFAQLNSTTTPANFAWSTGTNSKNEIPNTNLGDWVPATGGVTGAGLIGLLSGFTFSGNGAGPPSGQTFTLSGLTIGTTYETRLYIRVWDTEGSGRPITFTFNNGVDADPVTGPEDRPGDVLGTGNQQQAFYLSYLYSAQGTELAIDTDVLAGGPVDSGSFHMYGLTNQVIPEPTTAVCLALAGLVGVTRRRR